MTCIEWIDVVLSMENRGIWYLNHLLRCSSDCKGQFVSCFILAIYPGVPKILAATLYHCMRSKRLITLCVLKCKCQVAVTVLLLLCACRSFVFIVRRRHVSNVLIAVTVSLFFSNIFGWYLLHVILASSDCKTQTHRNRLVSIFSTHPISSCSIADTPFFTR